MCTLLIIIMMLLYYMIIKLEQLMHGMESVYSMYQVELNPEKQLKKLKWFFFSKKIANFFSQPCKWLMMTFKASTAVAPIQVQERAIIKFALLRLPQRKCIGNLWLAINVEWSIWMKWFWKFLVGQGVLKISQISRICVIVSMNY